MDAPTKPNPPSIGNRARAGKEFCSSLAPATSTAGDGVLFSKVIKATSFPCRGSSVSLALGVGVALTVGCKVDLGVAVGFWVGTGVGDFGRVGAGVFVGVGAGLGVCISSGVGLGEGTRLPHSIEVLVIAVQLAHKPPSGVLHHETSTPGSEE